MQLLHQTESYLCVRVFVTIGIDARDNVEIYILDQVVVHWFEKFGDGVKCCGGGDPFAGVDAGVYENRGFAFTSRGNFQDVHRARFVAFTDVDYGCEVAIRRLHVVQVLVYLGLNGRI